MNLDATEIMIIAEMSDRTCDRVNRANSSIADAEALEPVMVYLNSEVECLGSDEYRDWNVVRKV